MKFRHGPPIDRGWAWMVVLAAFMHLFILIGLARSSGMIFVELIEKYHGTASSASLMVSLQTGISLFLAPVITAAVELTSCRFVCFFGSLVYSTAFFISSCLDSLESIVFCYGILAGIGYGCCLTPTPVIVGRYFDKKRSLANGLAFSGTGLGNVLLPMLVYFLIDNYYLHGAMLVLSAFTLQTMIFAALYRPVALYSNTAAECKVVDNNCCVKSKMNNSTNSPRLVKFQTLQQKDELYNCNNISDQNHVTNNFVRLRKSTEDEDDFAICSEKSPRLNLKREEDEFSTDTDLYFTPREGPGSARSAEIISGCDAASMYESALDLAVLSSLQDIPRMLGNNLEMVPEEAPEEVYNDDLVIGQSNSRYNNKGTKTSSTNSNCSYCIIATVNNWFRRLKRNFQIFARKTLNVIKPSDGCSKSGKNSGGGGGESSTTAAKLFSLDLLRNFEYTWSLIGVVLFLNAFFLCMIVPAHCADLNFSKADAALMLSIQGFADMCGRLFTAFVGDRKFYRRYRRQAFCSYAILVTVLIFVLSTLKDFYTFSITLISCAFLFGAFVSMNPVVITDIVGVHNLAKAWGLQLFCEGFTLTLSPFIMGALKDRTGSYQAAFFYLGTSTCLASMCFIVSNFLYFKKLKINNSILTTKIDDNPTSQNH